jgi:hypothetical protein
LYQFLFSTPEVAFDSLIVVSGGRSIAGPISESMLGDQFLRKRIQSQFQLFPEPCSIAPWRSSQVSNDSHIDRAYRKKTRGKMTQKDASPETSQTRGTPTTNRNHIYVAVVVSVVMP